MKRLSFSYQRTKAQDFQLVLLGTLECTFILITPIRKFSELIKIACLVLIPSYQSCTISFKKSQQKIPSKNHADKTELLSTRLFCHMLFYGVLCPFLQSFLCTPGPEESFISSCFHSTLSLLSTLKLYTIPLEFANPARILQSSDTTSYT